MFKKWPGLEVRYDWYKARADKWDILSEWPNIRIEPKKVTVRMA